MFAKFFFYEYEFMESYFPGQECARPDGGAGPLRPAPRSRAPGRGGLDGRDAEGYLVDERGERFPTLTLEFERTPPSSASTRRTSRDLWDQAGIRMDLKYIDASTLLKKVWEYQLPTSTTGLDRQPLPEPIQDFHSKFADQMQTNNWSGFKDPEADRLMEAYRVEFDPEERVRMLQRLDAILFDAHPYALSWYGPHFRLLYWDRYGHPPGVRVGVDAGPEQRDRLLVARPGAGQPDGGEHVPRAAPTTPTRRTRRTSPTPWTRPGGRTPPTSSRCRARGGPEVSRRATRPGGGGRA